MASSVSGNKNLHTNIGALEEAKWYKLEISQTLVDGKVVYKDLKFKFNTCILVHVYSGAGWCKCLFC